MVIYVCVNCGSSLEDLSLPLCRKCMKALNIMDMEDLEPYFEKKYLLDP